MKRIRRAQAYASGFTMSRFWWRVVTYVALVAVLILMNWAVHGVDSRTFMLRVSPFLLASLLFYLFDILILIQTPTQRSWREVRWKIWRIYDPLSSTFLAAFFGVATYFLALTFGMSKVYPVHVFVYDGIRSMLTIGCLIGIPIVIELIVTSWHARRDGRLRRHETYGEDDVHPEQMGTP
jgi:hypothetical protein